MSDRGVNQRFYLMLGAITLAAAVLRLLWLDQTAYAFDQAQIALRALGMARAGRFAFMAPNSSVGTPHLPLSIWFFAILYRFTIDPFWVTTAMALLNGASGAVLGLIGRRAIGPAGGLVAAALYGFAPWSILFSRSIWQPDLMAPLAVAWAYAAWRSLVVQHSSARTRSWPWVTQCVLWAGLAPQVHYAGVALWPATAWLAIRGRWWARENWPGVAAGGVLATLAALPFVWAIWPERAGQLAALRAAGGEGWRLSADAGLHLLQIGSGLEFPVVAWGERAVLPGPWPDLQAGASWLLAAALLAGLALIVGEAGRREAARRVGVGVRSDMGIFLLLWVAGPALVFTVHSTPVYHHYLLISAPAMALALAWLVERLFAASGRARSLWSVVALLVMLAGLFQGALWSAGMARLVSTGQPDRLSLATQRALVQLLPAEGTVVVATDCDAHEVCNEAAVWETYLWSRDNRTIDGRHLLLLPEESDRAGAVLLLTPEAQVLWETYGHGATPMSEVGPYRLAQVEPGWASSLAGWTTLEPLTLASGAQLQGWRTEGLDGAVRLWTLWRVVSAPAQGQVQMFNHLYDGEEKVAAADCSVSIRAWQPGDRLITWADLPVPAGAGSLSFRVGMYDLATMERASIVERSEDAERAIVLE